MSWKKNDERSQIRRMLKGDEVAFEAFYKGHVHRLFRFTMARLGGNTDWSEEIVQRTMCVAMDKLHTFRGEAAVYTWLCTICRHEIAADLKRRGRRPLMVQLAEDEPEVRSALESLAALNDPESRTQQREVAQRVHAALDYLPTHYGNALEWKYILGLSVREIADLLDVKPKAAESVLTRARHAFREVYATLSNSGRAELLVVGKNGGSQS